MKHPAGIHQAQFATRPQWQIAKVFCQIKGFNEYKTLEIRKRERQRSFQEGLLATNVDPRAIKIIEQILQILSASILLTNQQYMKVDFSHFK